MEQKLLSHETLYISYFLKQNRIEYYDRLMEVRTKGNFEQWVKFFLRAIYESAQDAVQTIEELVKLHDKNADVVKNTGKAAKTVMMAILKQTENVQRNRVIAYEGYLQILRRDT